MNNPHNEKLHDNVRRLDVDADFCTFAEKAYKVYLSRKKDTDKADEVRELFLAVLNNDDKGEEENVPHTQGIEDDRLESDASGLMGGAFPQKAPSDDDEIEQAIRRRAAQRLMSRHGGYHQ